MALATSSYVEATGSARADAGRRRGSDRERWPDRIEGPVAVIGDVHGETAKLESLLRQVRALPDFADRWVVFLGDFVDRGPDPRGVIETVLDFRREHPRTAAVAGNHELAFTAALKAGDDSARARGLAADWVLEYGSEPTFASYGARPGDLANLAERVPRAHREFLAGLPYCVEHPDFLFVHAGLAEDERYEDQLDDLRTRAGGWRPRQLCSHRAAGGLPPYDCPKTVVSGHLPVRRVRFRQGRVMADTGAGRGGILSCVLLPEGNVLSARSPSHWLNWLWVG